jgi:hypothetical protein
MYDSEICVMMKSVRYGNGRMGLFDMIRVEFIIFFKIDKLDKNGLGIVLQERLLVILSSKITDYQFFMGPEYRMIDEKSSR